MTTARQYLVSLGLAKDGRGKFSKVAHEALSKAIADGMTFDEPVKVSTSSDTPRTPAVRTPKAYPVVPLEGDGPHSKRDYAASLGLALRGVRGRLSVEATAAINEAEANGMVFAEKPVAVKPKRISLVHPNRVSVADLDAQIDNEPLPDYDAKQVRAWAISKGKSVGARGRLHSDLIREWAADGGVFVPADTSSLPAVSDNGESKVVTEARERHSKLLAAAPSPAPEKVRDEAVAYVLWGAENGNAAVTGFSECGKCKRLVSHCSCDSVSPPSYISTPVSDVVFDKGLLSV